MPQLIVALGPNQELNTRLKATYELAVLGADAAKAIPALGNILSGHEAMRVATIYTMGAIGEPAVDPLMDMLKIAGNREAEHSSPRPWNEGAIPMEDAAHALAAIGSAAVPTLTEALESPDEWTRINAAFALGEMDSHARDAVLSLAKCLESASDRVVRTAADALGSIHQNVQAFIPNMSNLLVEERLGWDKVLTREWTAQDQVRTNVAMAFARLGKDATEAEDVLLDALDDPCGHVGAFAMHSLKCIGSPTATQGIMEYLQAQRWDESIRQDRQF